MAAVCGPAIAPCGLEVAEGGVDDARQHGAEAVLQGGLAGGGEAAVGAAVEGFGERQDLVLLRAVGVVGVLASKLDRGLDALGAGVAEEDPVEVRGFGQHPGDLGLQRDLVQVGAVDELLRLLLYGLDEGGVAVAQGVRGDAADKVQIAVAFVVEEPAPSPLVGAISRRL